MIIGPRPTLGWVAYLMIRGSWYRYALIMVAFALVTLVIVDEGQKTVTLRFAMPAPFPPPLVFVASPNSGYMTPLDACAIEAASVGETRPHDKHEISLYLWQRSVISADVWANWILEMPWIHVSYMDMPQLLERSEVSFLRGVSELETWKTWLGARLGFLWIVGGIVMPFGTIMTKPLSIDKFGTFSGLLLEGKGGSFDPQLMAMSSQHPIVSHMAKRLMNNTRSPDDNEIDGPGRLLTEAVKEVCGVNNLQFLANSDCKMFEIIKKNQVFDLVNDMGTNILEPEGTRLLRYMDEPYNHLDDGTFQKLFHTKQLNRFCPETARHLELRILTTTNL